MPGFLGACCTSTSLQIHARISYKVDPIVQKLPGISRIGCNNFEVGRGKPQKVEINNTPLQHIIKLMFYIQTDGWCQNEIWSYSHMESAESEHLLPILNRTITCFQIKIWCDLEGAGALTDGCSSIDHKTKKKVNFKLFCFRLMF